jgi:hypothetical protein
MVRTRTLRAQGTLGVSRIEVWSRLPVARSSVRLQAFDDGSHNMASLNGLKWSLLALLALGSGFPGDPSQPVHGAGPMPPVVQRFLDRHDEPLSSYRALRRLEAHNTRYKKHGWIEAWTSLNPRDGFRFEIVAEGGSRYVRDKVLRKALEREAEAHARAETRTAAIAPANYAFAESRPDVDGMIEISIEPVRKDPLLVRGRIYLIPVDADLVRIEGQLSKTPSFWTRRVEVTRRYRRIEGVRVPVATDSVADVVLAGRSTFTMTYEYATINGREAGRPEPSAAAASTPRGDR